MKLENLNSTYFLGIGGIGMSALARYFAAQGIAVAGYDRTETTLTRKLVDEGIEVRYVAAPDALPANIDLAVWTPALPKDFSELVAVRERNIPLMKRAEVLGLISESKNCIAIAGTHGKTTTSTLATYLVRAGGVDATGFLGGLSSNFGTNYVAGDSDWVVVEADEFDRSFLHLSPQLAVITSVDADHLDIYGSAEAIISTGFQPFAERLKNDGKLLVHHSAAAALNIENLLTYGIDVGDWQATNLRVDDASWMFDLKYPTAAGKTETYADVRFTMPGKHNVENAVAALAMGHYAGANLAAMIAALPEFKGIKRRFERVAEKGGKIFIDDYAHHPTELDAAIEAARDFYPHQKVLGIFQPHLFSRTQDFMDAFAKSLAKLDELWLLDIYPARELPIEGITSAALAAKINGTKVRHLAKAEVLEALQNTDNQVIMTLGAGDIDTLVEPIEKIIMA